MPIHVEWLDEAKTCIWYAFVNKWTWENLFTAIETDFQMRRSVHYMVSTIIDVRETQHVPVLTPSHLAKVAAFSTMQHPAGDVGYMILGASEFLKMMFNIFGRIHPQAAERYQFVDTIEALETLMAQHNPSQTVKIRSSAAQ